MIFILFFLSFSHPRWWLTICSIRGSVTTLICLPPPYLVVVEKLIENTTKVNYKEG